MPAHRNNHVPEAVNALWKTTEGRNLRCKGSLPNYLRVVDVQGQIFPARKQGGWVVGDSVGDAASSLLACLRTILNDAMRNTHGLMERWEENERLNRIEWTNRVRRTDNLPVNLPQAPE